MTLHLYGNENGVVTYLKANGLSDIEARIYTAILCRQYRAPREELISLLKYHLPGLAPSPRSMESEINSAIENLITGGLVKVIDGLKEDPLEACNPWEQALKERLLKNNPVQPEIAEIIAASLKNFADFSLHEQNLIERLGWATWEKPRESFREAIRQARQQIRMGVYSSITVYDEIKNEIKEALVNHRQMEVQILMFSPKLAAKMESNPDLAKDVEIRTKDWKRLYDEAWKEARGKGNKPKLEIRHLHYEEMAAFHRVLLVDNRRWMLNVHRPGVERGIEGIVYQGSCEDRSPSNLYNLLDHYWGAAWESGVDPSLHKRVLHYLRNYLHFIVLGALVLLAWYAHKNNGDWWGIKNDWWGGAFVGLIIAEAYNNGSKFIHDILELLEWLLEVLKNIFTSRK